MNNFQSSSKNLFLGQTFSTLLFYQYSEPPENRVESFAPHIGPEYRPHFRHTPLFATVPPKRCNHTRQQPPQPRPQRPPHLRHNQRSAINARDIRRSHQNASSASNWRLISAPTIYPYPTHPAAPPLSPILLHSAVLFPSPAMAK